MPLFEGLPAKLLTLFAQESAFKVLAPGAEICREGEFTAEVYVVLSGMVGVYKRAGVDQLEYLTSLARGSWFGEMSCMSSAPRSATIKAESETVVLEIPRHTFMKGYADRTGTPLKERVDAGYRKRALGNHLGAVALFRGVDRPIIRRIAGVCELVVAEKGQAIVRHGEPGDAFYLIRTGHARVVGHVEGKHELLAWLCENSFFGEMALLHDKPRTATVQAVDRMDLVRIPKQPFLALLSEHPAVERTVMDRVRRLYDEEFLSPEEAAARARAREIGTEHEVVKAGDALVIDMSKCTRCNLCVEGCIDAHEDGIPRIGKRGIRYGDLLLTSSCYNCKVPDCMLSCKFGAIRRNRTGQVRIDTEACTGCALCVPACPYGTIHMEAATAESPGGGILDWLSQVPVLSRLVGKQAPEVAAEEGRRAKNFAVKCDLCAGRSDMACISNCPCGAIERISPEALLGGGA
jgi:CRP-like cAMP-binding protein/Fe-S-cluster-containing hydrogenase component 2